MYHLIRVLSSFGFLVALFVTFFEVAHGTWTRRHSRSFINKYPARKSFKIQESRTDRLKRQSDQPGEVKPPRSPATAGIYHTKRTESRRSSTLGIRKSRPPPSTKRAVIRIDCTLKAGGRRRGFAAIIFPSLLTIFKYSYLEVGNIYGA